MEKRGQEEEEEKKDGEHEGQAHKARCWHEA